jgi:hypothetical protein
MTRSGDTASAAKNGGQAWRAALLTGTTAAIMAIAAMHVAPAQANLVGNGGFEKPEPFGCHISRFPFVEAWWRHFCNL